VTGERSSLAVARADLLDPRSNPWDEAGVASPAALARVASGGAWRPAAHLALLDRYLVDLAAGRIGRLFVTTPPQHGKSELCSVALPAWYLGTRPDRMAILAAYESTFAERWGRRARDVLEEVGRELFGVALREGSAAASRWETTRGGGMVATGAGGPITGRGADLFIIDAADRKELSTTSPSATAGGSQRAEVFSYTI
jgi:hypothetical protein